MKVARWLIGGMVVGVAVAGELATLPHPRLLFPTAAEEVLAAKLREDPLAARIHAAALAEADQVLKARPCIYLIPDGRRLLAESRRALHNVMHAGWAWRTTGREEYRRRVIAELEAACGLKDWNPSHFLDTAEMAAAVAIGYDWLHGTLSPEQRTMCVRAITSKALEPARDVYRSKGWWSNPRNNWSQVCGAGIALAAAAVAEDEPLLGKDLYRKGAALVAACGDFYQPDGMYPEGPGYWQYGTNYHVLMYAAAEALGRPLPQDPILRKAGDAVMQLTGPTRLSFNFADGRASTQTPSPAQCWISDQFADETQSGFVRSLFERALEESEGRLDRDRFLPLAILWLPRAAERNDLPFVAAFRGEQATAMFRTSWEKDAAWLAIKGGTPAASHGHMDVGSFVFEAHGIRWIHDMGAENYNLPGYFGGNRWKYHRLLNRTHNTLEIDGRLQDPESEPCPLIDSDLTGESPTAAFDLSAAYKGSAGKLVRRARFDRGSGTTRIEDEITKPAGGIVWRAFTRAAVDVSGDTVKLRQDGESITLRIIQGGGGWRVGSAKPPTPEEDQNEGFRSIEFETPAAGRVEIVVEIRP